MSNPATSLERSTETILVIDDDDSIRKIYSSVLERCGYEVLSAANGLDGLATYEQRRDDIALVLLDWTMEGMSGEEVLNRLWSTNSQSKIFIISGYHIPSEELADKAEALQKPLSIKELVSKVREALDH